MNISPIFVKNNYSNSNYISKKQEYSSKAVPSFGGGTSNIVSEKSLRSCEYGLRVIANKLSDLFTSRRARAITKNISEITPDSNERYLHQLDEISRLFATSKDVEVNIEDKILEEIAQTGKSTIFIMNHSNQKEDPSMLAVLNTLLTDAYICAGLGKEKPFPLPKIILNKDILTTMNKTKRKAFEAFGAVGIDANVVSADKAENSKIMFPLIRDFIKNKCNIFIFPEGKLAVRTDMSFEERFQSGIAEMINKILGVKKEVTVVPAGFSYGKGEFKNVAGIQIGKPIVFLRKGDITTSSSGSVLDSEFAFDGFKNFFIKHSDKVNVPITENGNPVRTKDIVGFIKGILCENLNICVKEAEKRIKTPCQTESVMEI